MYCSQMWLSYFGSEFSLHSHVTASPLEPHEGRPTGIIRNILELLWWFVCLFFDGLTRVLIRKAMIYTILRACPTVTKGHKESQVKYRYLFLLVRANSDEHSLILSVSEQPCTIILWSFCQVGQVHLKLLSFLVDIFLFDQVLDLVKFRSDKLEIFLNNMAHFQQFSFMDALVFAFSFVVFCNILFDIGTVSLVNAESV